MSTLTDERRHFFNVLDTVTKEVRDNVMYAYHEAIMRGEVCQDLGAAERELLRRVAKEGHTEGAIAAMQMIGSDLGFELEEEQ